MSAAVRGKKSVTILIADCINWARVPLYKGIFRAYWAYIYHLKLLKCYSPSTKVICIPGKYTRQLPNGVILILKKWWNLHSEYMQDSHYRTQWSLITSFCRSTSFRSASIFWFCSWNINAPLVNGKIRWAGCLSAYGRHTNWSHKE